ncbi:lysozyme g-like [Anguilla rostrata]|uniref:lysozyme g-like n=1 Tax=Anguilla rostrata TaxID=7938 RepID=UPI0030CDDFA3
MACIYGDVNRIETTGASRQTANQDNLPMQGVSASHELARTDLSRVNQYKDAIQRAAQAHQIDPAVVAAIISRETRGGSPHVMSNGWGDHGYAFGLMQVDRRHHKPEGEWNSQQHIIQGTGILAWFINQMKAKFPSWSKEQQLKGGIAAYNCGDQRVCSYEEIDSNTTRHDYSNDVVARAQFYKRNGF